MPTSFVLPEHARRKRTRIAAFYRDVCARAHDLTRGNRDFAATVSLEERKRVAEVRKIVQVSAETADILTVPAGSQITQTSRKRYSAKRYRHQWQALREFSESSEPSPPRKLKSSREVTEERREECPSICHSNHIIESARSSRKYGERRLCLALTHASR